MSHHLIRYKHVGGIRFLRIHRLTISWSVSRKPLRSPRLDWFEFCDYSVPTGVL